MYPVLAGYWSYSVLDNKIVHSSYSSQTGQHEPCKGGCCPCLGTETDLLEVTKQPSCMN